MLFIRVTLICATLALSACSSDNSQSLPLEGTDTNGPANNTGENTGEPGNEGTEASSGLGSITISAVEAPELDPLPDVTFTPGTNSGDGSPEAIDGVVALPVSSTTAEATGSASTDTGGTTGGTSDAGTSTAGTDAGAGDDATDASVATTDSIAPPTRPIIVDPVEPRPDFQSGSLTAADYDDQLNPHLYQSYASEYLQRVGGRLDVPYLDLSNRIGLHVTDEQGLPYSGASIDITNANGQVVSLKTPSTGITYIYTDADQLSDQFTIRATGIYGTAIDKTIDLAQAVSGRIDIVIPEDAVALEDMQPAAVLDLMFVIDTTGSMGDELFYLQTELTSIINALPTDNAGINVGLTFYRDLGDEYVVRAHGFNDDISDVQNTLNNETFGGGGDYPEAMDQALLQAIDANWQQDSSKILFLIADAPPHADRMRATWEAAEQARSRNIHIVPVAASGVAEDAEYLMRSIAAYTNSRYVFLTDDSGFGNAHAEPDVDCYVVTPLNNLMIRVINSLLAGVRQEPTDNDIIRREGSYNNGVCDPLVFTQ